MNTEVRQQEKLDIAEERDIRRRKLPEKFIAKMLYKQNDRKFEEKLEKIEVSFSKEKP